MDLKELEHLAELSKLKFSEDELKEFEKDFTSLVELADVVKNANVTGERKLNIIDMAELREDEVKESTPVDVLLQNSPIVKKDSIVVPRIME
ncbi:MAG: Asp-tRNA(Asn)/Glu-tRNA(Gln) amidotransferase subunit GatC [Clostridiales bacterium]|nr:Asp-tRNA(Asn)/Glu-tRNA(Gln) amidotransferase subunit GatC [Clostridiales bacterium]